MKRNLLIVVFLVLISFVWAQELLPWQYIRHTSRLNSGDVFFRFNSTSPEFSNHQFWRLTSSGWWAQEDLQYVGDMVYEAHVPYSFGTSMKYRLRSEVEQMGETLVVMHNAHLDSNTFPPVLDAMAWIADDPTGDIDIEAAPMLDLTASYIGVSSTLLHSAIQNVQGTFPTMNTLSSYNVYLTLISNPESTITDSVVYAMVNTFNIPGVISPGLYKLGVDPDLNPVFERIGNIQSQVSGGKLYMSCNMDDLVNDPGFGAWPNIVNSLAFTSLTMRITLDLTTLEPQFFFGDYTAPAVVSFDNLVHHVDQNTLPVISNPIFTENSLGYLLTMDYFDADADYAYIAELVTNNQELIEFETLALDFSDTVTYFAQLPSEWLYADVTFGDTNAEVVNMRVYHATGAADEYVLPVKPVIGMTNPFRINGSGQIINLQGFKTGELKMEVFNLKGQRLGSIFEAAVDNSDLSINWNGRVNGINLTPGVYFLKVSQGTIAQAKKFIVLR